MNNAVFGKTLENVRKHRTANLITNGERRNYLVYEPNYKATKRFSEKLFTIEMTKAKVITNKKVFLSFYILDYHKIEMYEF